MEKNTRTISNELSVQPDFRPIPELCRAIAAWHEDFYSKPANRAAYAAWCRDNGLEYDLDEPPQGE